MPAKASEASTLRQYRAKRDFAKTPEPASSKGSRRASPGDRFVVQMHRASHLHFDFRLEAGGTLKSWAVPKGPSMDPADKRLAMQVEDHPLDYAGFEGQIPKGNYGAGEVIVWDAGTYRSIDGADPARAIAAGSLKFILNGKKLRGSFALVKIRSRDAQENAWLLIKERDEFATSAAAKRDDRSVLTKRTLDDVAKNPRAKKWYSNRTERPAKAAAGVKKPKAPAPASVLLTRPEKVLFPADGYTKADLAAYYDAVARWMVPYLKDRPLSLERFPNGVRESSFFEKNVPRGAPAWLRTELVSGGERHSDVRYIVCDDRSTLAYLANLAAITLHVWTSRVVHLDIPDYVFFDLDPGERCPVRRTVAVALELRTLLAEIGLRSLVKTSGGSGLHVLVPLKAAYDYAIVRAFGELVARRLAEILPDDITLLRATARRPPDLVYFDFVQIGHGKTMVAPYTVRARDGAPVSMPLSWSAVEKMRASRAPNADAWFKTWTIKTVPSMLKRGGDAWAGEFSKPQSLERAVKTSRSKWASRE